MNRSARVILAVLRAPVPGAGQEKLSDNDSELPGNSRDAP